MNFINDVHTHFYLRRCINRIIPQITHIVYTVVGCSIDLQNIHAGTGINGLTTAAAITGVSILWVFTIDRFSKDFCAAGFARSPRTGEQVCMTELTT